MVKKSIHAILMRIKNPVKASCSRCKCIFLRKYRYTVCPPCLAEREMRKSIAQQKAVNTRKLFEERRRSDLSFIARLNYTHNCNWYGPYENIFEIYKLLEEVYGNERDVPYYLEIEQKGKISAPLLSADEFRAALVTDSEMRGLQAACGILSSTRAEMRRLSKKAKIRGRVSQQSTRLPNRRERSL